MLLPFLHQVKVRPPYYFTEAPLVTAGSDIKSSQLKKLALAFNDRIRSGIGDATYRIFFYIFNMFRDIYMDSGEGLQALRYTDAMFFESLQAYGPDAASWPLGEEVNAANLLVTFINGYTPTGFPDEATLINTILQPPGCEAMPQDPDDEYWWDLAKVQRGAYDPDFNIVSVTPAFDSARTYAFIRPYGMHGQAWGGYMPTPGATHPIYANDPDTGESVLTNTSDVCYDGVGGYYPNIHYKFTSLIPGIEPRQYLNSCIKYCSDINQDGSCNSWSYGDHVDKIVRGAYNYYIYFNNGTMEVLSKNKWIEGPYDSDPTLKKTMGDHIQRVVSKYISSFSGSTSDTVNDNLHNAFDFQRFFTKYYHLAPNYGSKSGENIDAYYPEFVFQNNTIIDNHHTGDYAVKNESDYKATTHIIPIDFVSTGCLIRQLKLDSTNNKVGIEILKVIKRTNETIVRTDVVKAIEITPVTAGSSQLVLFDNAIANEHISATEDHSSDLRSYIAVRIAYCQNINDRNSSDIKFTDSTGYISIEFNQVLAYKPEIFDAYLLLRAYSTMAPGTVDGDGSQIVNSKEASDSYFTKGVIRGRNNQTSKFTDEDNINRNAVFEAARKISSYVRCIPRGNLKRYAVEDGKSVLWFDRYTTNTIASEHADMFYGIGPSTEEILSGSIKSGYEYVVKDGTITYNGQTKLEDATFAGQYGISTFTGSGKVYEYNGIRAVAPRNEYTNEWLVNTQLKAYRYIWTDQGDVTQNSMWKPDLFSDLWPINNRCHFLSPELGGNAETLYHAGYGRRTGALSLMLAEIPSGYNYMNYTETGTILVQSANTSDCKKEDLTISDPCLIYRRRFYRSCPIYQPDPEIESAVMDHVLVANPNVYEDWIKITFKSRLHHCDIAPKEIDKDEIDKDSAGYEARRLALQAEPYRTVENGIREYLYHISNMEEVHCNPGGYEYFTEDALVNQAGNHSIKSVAQLTADNPYGTCYPHFIFTKLVPLPYEDNNDSQDTHDTQLKHDPFTQMELYLRAMCEGYIDGVNSGILACQKTTQLYHYDYTYENLCMEANGVPWMKLMPSVATAYLTGDNIRPIAPTGEHSALVSAEGYAPLPNTYASAEIFNQYSKAINLLTKARIMLPFLLQTRQDDSVMTFEISADTSVPASAPSAEITVPIPPAPTFNVKDVNRNDVMDKYGNPIPMPWIDCTSGEFATIDPVRVVTSVRGFNELTGKYIIEVIRSDIQIRCSAMQADTGYALSGLWRHLLESDATIMAETVPNTTMYTRELVPLANATLCSSTGTARWGAVRFNGGPSNPDNNKECVELKSQYSITEELGKSWIYWDPQLGCGGYPGKQINIILHGGNHAAITVPLY